LKRKDLEFQGLLMREERLVDEQGQKDKGWVVLVPDKAMAMARRFWREKGIDIERDREKRMREREMRRQQRSTTFINVAGTTKRKRNGKRQRGSDADDRCVHKTFVKAPKERPKLFSFCF